MSYLVLICIKFIRKCCQLIIKTLPVSLLRFIILICYFSYHSYHISYHHIVTILITSPCVVFSSFPSLFPSHSRALKQLSSFIQYVVLSSSSLIIFIIPTMTQSTFSFSPSFYQRPPSFLYNFHPFNIITQLASSFSHYFSLSSFSLVIFAPFSCHHATAILVFSLFFILILSHHPQRGIMCRETQFEKLKILFPPHGKARHQKLFPGQCRPKLFTLKYIPSMTKCISSVYLFSVYL